ncbi:hypothetical protein BC835DRAFT_324660 [Cytidiella melzeri]|nr:hypothetical protein BC835DRAFT_324660 [Cytidiella melzeri]
MSLLLTSYVTLLALCVAWVDLVSAQNLNTTFMNDFLGNLQQNGLTNFTALVQQVSDDGLLAFAVALTRASSPKTLFVPNNAAFLNPGVNFGGYDYQPDNTSFLSSLLLYHLAEGSWTQDQLVGVDTIIVTSLVGDAVTLENDSPQVMVCGSTANGFEILNQRTTTHVLQAYEYDYITVQVVNAIIGMPGSSSFAVSDVNAEHFAALQTSAGLNTLDTDVGMTVFVPTDDAFLAENPQTTTSTPLSLFNNHIITGKTVWSPDFIQPVQYYTSDSGMNYTFTQNSTNQYTVSLNGITANIVRTDYLVSNGVMHIVDRVLSNTTHPIASPVGADSTGPTTILLNQPSSSSSALISSTGLSAAQTTTTSSESAAIGPTTTAGASSTSSPSGSLSVGPIIGIAVVGASLLFFSVIGFMVWRANRRAKMGWQIRRQARSSKFDLDSGDREANLIEPFTPISRGHNSNGANLANLRDALHHRPVLSIVSVGSDVPIQGQYYAPQEKTPISPPDAVVRQGISDSFYEVPHRISMTAGRPRADDGTFPVDVALLRSLVQHFPPPASQVSAVPQGRVEINMEERPRPPTYYSTARSTTRHNER